MLEFVMYIVGGVFGLIFIGFPIILKTFYRKVEQSQALVRNGMGGSKVSFSGMWIIPILHQYEKMDVSIKSVEICRMGKDGLICQDNLRADIKVAFFVRVNHTSEDVLRVAQLLGIEKSSNSEELMRFFEAKFSEALKTAGKKFDFVHLYTERETFKREILQVIGKDLNGFVLDDAAIDYLEQTDIKFLNANNVLDSEGIKKITELTAEQAILANKIQRDKEKTITQQDVSTREAVLELQKQQAEAEQKQRREIESIKAREDSTIRVVQEEERLKSENVRIKTQEEIAVAEENKNRQVIIAQKAKESTEAVENERVDKNRLLERTEKEKIVTIAQIEKDKQVEIEKKNIQEVIKERVMVEKAVVAEEEKIKDTRAFAEAARTKEVTIKASESIAESSAVEKIKSAEAEKRSIEILSEKELIQAETSLKASYKKAEATKILADASAEEASVTGFAEARASKARSEAVEAEGIVRTKIMKLEAESKAKGIELETQARSKGIELEGIAEAKVIKEKTTAEAEGITKKADAMKKYDSVGKEHEEFKLRLNTEKEISLAKINIQKDIARAQADVISEGLKNAKIDIVGGESMFFDKLVSSITLAKQVDSLVDKSEVISDIKNTFINGDPENFKAKLKKLVSNFNLNTEDFKNLTVSAAIMKFLNNSNVRDKKLLQGILNEAKDVGVDNELVGKFLE